MYPSMRALAILTFAFVGCSNKDTCPNGSCSSADPSPSTPASVPSPTGAPPVTDASATVPDAGVPCCGSNDDMTTAAAPDLTAPANPAGPWPIADLTLYNSAQGLGPIIDASPDDAQNIWAVANDTLYLLTPGSTTFRKFTAADGLHIGPFTDAYGNPNTTWITATAGGHANEVFVGYYGYETNGNPYLDTEAQKELGNADKVVLDPVAGKITITRYLFRCDYEGGNGCWEDRSPRKMVFAHTGVAAGRLFIGFNHGVSHVFNDTFGDHVHPEVWYHYPDGSVTEKLGEFYGVAFDPQGNAWMAGRYGVGLQPFNPVPHLAWVSGHFIYAFTIYGPGHALDVPSGYVENDSGIAVMPNGHVYISSFTMGLTHWDPAGSRGNYQTMSQVSGVPGSIQDIAADPDGSLWIVDTGGTLWRYNPANGQEVAWPRVSGALRVVVDATVIPRSVYVSMNGGLAVIRAK